MRSVVLPPYPLDEEDDPTGVDVAKEEESPDVPDLPALGTFGHYDMLGRLGVGGMAEIFLARDRLGSAKVKHLVIKTLPEELADDPQAVVMFLDEARLANRLYHPNVCHVYESGEVDGTYYMAMEWVHGPSLRRIIRRATETRPPPIGVGVRIISHVARALDYVHHAQGEGGRPLNIVHRDVSPQNVMISWKGRVKLLDFGIAKSAAQYARTRAGVVKGKYAYMAPEQCRAEPVDARSDVFALGTCAYEILTLTPLFHRDNVLATMKAVTSYDPPPLTEVSPSVPKALEDIVLRALKRDPAQRWQSAREFGTALERFAAEYIGPVRAQDVAEYLDAIFTPEDRIPLPPVTRQTGSYRSGVLSGVGPFGQVDKIEPPRLQVEAVARPPKRAPSLPPAEMEAEGGGGRAALLFVITFVLTAAATGAVLWLTGAL